LLLKKWLKVTKMEPENKENEKRTKIPAQETDQKTRKDADLVQLHFMGFLSPTEDM
jgi:hypothetical protein